jgi:hypothetical protein
MFANTKDALFCPFISGFHENKSAFDKKEWRI